MKWKSQSTLTINQESDRASTLPRLHALRSRKTNMTTARLIVDDKETKDTIKTAMKQIGTSKGKRNESVAELSKLARRTTLNAMQKPPSKSLDDVRQPDVLF